MAATDSFFVTRTMQTLEVLAFQSASASQVASVLRVDSRTARRLLNRLTDEGWLTRSEGRTRTYSISLRVVALAAHFGARVQVARAAVDPVSRLHSATGATAHLVIPSYRCVLCLVHDAGTPDARPGLRELVPAHATAGGKALLAHREWWRESILELPLDRLTERTIVDPDELRAQCAAIQDAGFAVDDGEYRDDLQGIAVPVRDRAGEVIAAVALTGDRDLQVSNQRAAIAAAAAEVEADLAEAES